MSFYARFHVFWVIYAEFGYASHASHAELKNPDLSQEEDIMPDLLSKFELKRKTRSRDILHRVCGRQKLVKIGDTEN